MAEKVPCFQLGFDVLKVENSDDIEESERWLVILIKIYLHLLKVALIFGLNIAIVMC